MDQILTSFGTEMNELSPVSSLVPAGYKSNTKKPHNRKKIQNAYKQKRKHKITKKQKK